MLKDTSKDKEDDMFSQESEEEACVQLLDQEDNSNFITNLESYDSDYATKDSKLAISTPKTD